MTVLFSSDYPLDYIAPLDASIDSDVGALVKIADTGQSANVISDEVVFSGYAIHTAGAGSDLTNAGCVASGKSYSTTMTMLGRTAGDATLLLGTQAGTTRSTNGKFVEAITSNGTDAIVRCSSNFDGKIIIVITKQTNILASSAFSTPGDNPLDGDDTGTTPGVAGNGRIRFMKSDDGATSYTDRLSAEYNSLQNPTAFTKMIAIRKSVWDTTERYILHDYIDVNNWDAIYTSTTQDQVVFEHRAGGITEQITWDSSGVTNIILLDMGVVSGVFKARVNGVNIGSETIAGTQVGNLTIATLGAKNTTPTNVHLGDRAYAELFGAYIPDTDSLAIARSMGVS